jgi:hypothetical protein
LIPILQAGDAQADAPFGESFLKALPGDTIRLRLKFRMRPECGWKKRKD